MKFSVTAEYKGYKYKLKVTPKRFDLGEVYGDITLYKKDWLFYEKVPQRTENNVCLTDFSYFPPFKDPVEERIQALVENLKNISLRDNSTLILKRLN